MTCYESCWTYGSDRRHDILLTDLISNKECAALRLRKKINRYCLQVAPEINRSRHVKWIAQNLLRTVYLECEYSILGTCYATFLHSKGCSLHTENVTIHLTDYH